MKKIIQELETAITKYYALLKETNDENFSKKPALNKWSKQEELGHLIDSAQNNIQRFIRVQYEENVHIRYNQNNGVIMNNYQKNKKMNLNIK